MTAHSTPLPGDKVVALTSLARSIGMAHSRSDLNPRIRAVVTCCKSGLDWKLMRAFAVAILATHIFSYVPSQAQTPAPSPSVSVAPAPSLAVPKPSPPKTTSLDVLVVDKKNQPVPLSLIHISEPTRPY